jgi:hypothetical protein
MKNNARNILLSALLSAMCGVYAMEVVVSDEEEVFPEQLAWREKLLYSLGAGSVKLSQELDGRELFKKLLESSCPDLEADKQGEPLWLFVRRSCDCNMIEILREHEKNAHVIEKLSNTARLGIAIADQNFEEVRELVKKTDIECNSPVNLLDLAIEFAFATRDSSQEDVGAQVKLLQQKSREIVGLILSLSGLDVTACKNGSPLLHPAIADYHTNSGPMISQFYDPKWYLFVALLDIRSVLNLRLDINVRNCDKSLLWVLCRKNAPTSVIRRLCDEPDLDMKASGITTNAIFDAWRYEDPTVVDVLYVLAERGLTFQKDIECSRQWELADHALVLGANTRRVNFSQGGENVLFGLWEDWIATLDDWGSCLDSCINNGLRSKALEKEAKKSHSDPGDVAITSTMRFFLEIIVGGKKTGSLPSGSFYRMTLIFYALTHVITVVVHYFFGRRHVEELIYVSCFLSEDALLRSPMIVDTQHCI